MKYLPVGKYEAKRSKMRRKAYFIAEGNFISESDLMCRRNASLKKAY